MNSLHGIQLANSAAVARGKALTFNRHTGQLQLRGEPLTPVFLTRRASRTI